MNILQTASNILRFREKDKPLEYNLFFTLLTIEIAIALIATVANYISFGWSLVTFFTVSATILVALFLYLLLKNIQLKYILITRSITTYLLLGIIWAVDGGIYGPDSMITILLLFISLICIPQKQRFYIFLFYMLFFISLYIYQYKNPNSFRKPDFNSMWNENIIGFIYTSVGVFFAANFIYKTYTKERLKNQQQNAELLKTTELLLESNASKDRFFSIIAHDLKSPFNAIIGFSHLMNKKIQEQDYNSVQKYAEIIQQSSQRAMDVLTNLLLWSRSQSGKIEFKPEELNSAILINDTLDFLQATASLKQIEFKHNINKDITIFADKDMMDTILRNIVSNAIKYTPEKGNIYIQVIQIDKTVQFSIKDTGIGIPRKNLDQLFSLSGPVSTPGTNREQGTGLGLMICHDFVLKHGGRIWAESEVNKGTVFHFTIPYEQI